MKASARTCGSWKCSRQHGPKCMLQSNHILIIPHRVIQLTTITFCASHKSTNRPFSSEASEVSTPSSIFFLFLPHPQESCLSSQPIRGKVRRIGRMFPEYAERSFLGSEYTVVAVRRISSTRFAKLTFAQLRTGCRRIGPRTF